MGRKKKEVIEAEQAQSEQAEPVEVNVDEIRQRHGELIGRVEELRGAGDYFKTRISLEMKNHLTETLDGKIGRMISDLETVDKKDLEKSQGHIAGLRDAKQIILGTAWDSELQRAEKDLAEFEEANALFLQEAQPADVLFSVPEGAASLVIETKILQENASEEESNMTRDLVGAGFVYADQTGDETELWKADLTDLARAYMARLAAEENPLVVELRAE